MEKADEISVKVCRESVNDVTTGKNNKQHTSSETSNLESVSSSYSTFSENAESKVNMKTSDTNKFSGLECRDEPNMVSGSVIQKTKPSTSTSIDSLGCEKVVPLQTASVSMDFKPDGEGLMDKGNHSSGRAGDFGADVEKSSHCDESENIKGSVGNQKENKEVGIKKDGGNPPEEPSKPTEQGLEEEKVTEIVKDSSADDSGESDVVEHDVKVCDICGDAGREDLLAICCRCIDGAEHTYCMKKMIEQVPEGDWLCEECKLDEENKNTNRHKVEEPRTTKDHSFVKVSGKRRLEESESSSAAKKQALEIITGSPRTSSSTKDVDRGKLKSTHQFSSESLFGNDSPERPRSQSSRGSFFKSNSFNFSNARSKTKLVDEIVLQRQKSTKERDFHDTIPPPKEMGKSMSFRSTNMGRLGTNNSKVKMLSPKISHVPDLKSLKNKKERNFERNNSVKSASVGNLSTSSSTALTPKGEKSQTAPTSEVNPLKGESKMIAGLKSNSRSSNIGQEVNKQLPSPLPGVGTASSSGNLITLEQKSAALKDENTSKPAISKETKESQDFADGSHSGQVQTADRIGSAGNSASGIRNSKEVKNRDNKLKDAIEAALLKKPGLCRKSRVSDQSDESLVNNEVVIDRIPNSRNPATSTFAEVLTDHFKQSNGKHSTAELGNHDAVSMSSHVKISAIPDLDYIWQGSFEICRSGKTAEFWDGLQAHMSTCASPKVFEAVNNLPHKILLNGVSRISAWPEQFESSGVQEDNIALYFFAKDVESYEKSYQVLLDDMIRGDLALIGSINGVELLIFPSNQLPEKCHRWNMLFFLWGVFRGKKNSVPQVVDHSAKNCIPQAAPSNISTDKISQAEDVCSFGSIEKDKNLDLESKVNSKEKSMDSVPTPIRAEEMISLKPVISETVIIPNNDNKNPKVEQSTQIPTEIEPKKRAFIDLSEENDEINTWSESSKKPKIDLNGQGQNSDLANQKDDHENNANAGNSNGERFFFPVDPTPTTHEVKAVKMGLGLDLNEDIMTKKDEDEDVDVASSLSLSLSFSPVEKVEEDRVKGNRNSTTPSMLLFRDIVDK